MMQRGSAGVVAAAVMCLSGCIAPDIELIGALGVTVDEEGRPVIVVEACEGAAGGVHLSFDREGLADDEENESAGEWTASTPVTGTSELAPHAPVQPWQGETVELSLDRGYIATGTGEGEDQVLSQVAFSGSALAGLDPAMVYSNDADPDVTTLVAHTPEDFSSAMCSRPGMGER